MSEGKDKPKKTTEGFHETEYYSKFHEQEASVPSQPGAEDPTGEIDEETIQELMDATLTAGGSEKSGSTDLDTEIKSDWAENPQEQSPALGTQQGQHTHSQGKTIQRPSRNVVGKRKKPRKKKRWWRYRGKLFTLLKFFFFILLIGSLAGSVWYVEVTNRNTFTELQTEAGAKHSSGDYVGAIECYQKMMNLVPTDDWYRRTRLTFLTAAAHEELWHRDPSSVSNFENALRDYDQVVASDQSEMRVYAVESLLAKSEMLIEKARTENPVNQEDFDEGKHLLEELLANPDYQSNPTVHKGVPHRRLASLIREEDPTRAIDLLAKARSNQGDLEEGYENLEIGLIYRDLLEDPDQAVEFFERVSQNELAPPEVKNLAENLLKELQATDIDDQDLYPEDMLEFFSEKEVEP